MFVCATLSAPGLAQQEPAKPLVAVDLSDARARVLGEALVESARNETAGLGLRLTMENKTRARKKLSLAVGPIRSESGAIIDAKNVTVYQVVAMPAETGRAEYVRQTGLETAERNLPGALVPMERDAKSGRVQLAQVRDGGRLDKVGNKEHGIAEPITFWIDLHVPAEQEAGEYTTKIEVMEKGLLGDKAIESLSVKVVVQDFVLADDRHLLMVAPVAWETLYAHWPKEFEAITPRLLNRDEPKHAGAVKVLDQIVRAAQRNRVQVVVSRVQPTVKWPAAAPPQVDWADFDSVVGPWISGQGFEDKAPYGYWPLPAVDNLDRYDRAARTEYWQAAATHFDQKEWLFDATVLMDRPASQDAERARREATAEAAAILRGHTKVRVTTPVPEGTLEVSDRPAEGKVDLASAGRVIAWGPGLVYAAQQAKEWPKGIEPPARFLSVGMNAATPYVGVGQTERDVRQWAWLAFRQDAGMVRFGEALAKQARADEPAGAGEQVWLYPGQWFGADGPVESLQLKWARRAAQDFEYLWLAQARGAGVPPETVATLLTKPVEIQAGQAADPVYGLMTGTVEQRVWEEARRIVARAIVMVEPGGKPDERKVEDLRLETVRWTSAQERPTVIAREARWSPGKDGDLAWLDVKLGVDVYSPAKDAAETNAVGWAALPKGWQMNPRPVVMPTLEPNRVRRVELVGRFNLDEAGIGSTGAGQVDFVSGYSGAHMPVKYVLPVGQSERREGQVKLDGELADWNEMDAIQNGAMVRMMSRPGVRDGELARAGTASAVYSAWGEDSFYVAFKLNGVSGEGGASRNFVEYQQRRAWGEDLCEVMVQGLFENGATGPIIHIVCKTGGGTWVERKGIGESQWTATAGGAGVLFAGRVTEGGVWRGELSVPWGMLEDAKFGRPKLLRFNFGQHKAATGESATWAGPVDYGREEGMMGVVVLRDRGR